MRLVGIPGGSKRSLCLFLPPFDLTLGTGSRMRLFGIPGGSLSNARPTYVFTPPFTLPFVAIPQETPGLEPSGGFILDMSGVYALTYNHIMIGYPDWVIVAPHQEFNSQVETTYIIAAGSNTAGVIASTNEICGC